MADDGETPLTPAQDDADVGSPEEIAALTPEAQGDQVDADPVAPESSSLDSSVNTEALMDPVDAEDAVADAPVAEPVEMQEDDAAEEMVPDTAAELDTAAEQDTAEPDTDTTAEQDNAEPDTAAVEESMPHKPDDGTDDVDLNATDADDTAQRFASTMVELPGDDNPLDVTVESEEHAAPDDEANASLSMSAAGPLSPARRGHVREDSGTLNDIEVGMRALEVP